ncbi:MAG: type II toxin-antitoxin system prevent-host-death family antitoxin [Deferrisomatales bacterium]|nr:type II toxin-antitoxin system prevent-host-death family antitoxin [Deferrisomatales bacterium]
MPGVVGVREAKAHLSALLGRVRRGEVITITDRGLPVARLVPMPAEASSLPDRIRELEEVGWVVENRLGSAGAVRPVVFADEGIAQRTLREDRDAR